MDEIWKGIIYKYPEAKHDCDDFAVVLACTGESDVMMWRKWGNSWIVPCHNKGKEKKHK